MTINEEFLVRLEIYEEEIILSFENGKGSHSLRSLNSSGARFIQAFEIRNEKTQIKNIIAIFERESDAKISSK